MTRLRASVLLTAFLATALGAQQKVQEQVEVEITTLPAGMLRTLTAPVLGPADAGQLLRRTRPILTTWVPLGGETPLEAVTTVKYVKEHHSTIGYPSVEDYEPAPGVVTTGMQARVRVDRLPGGGFLVAVHGRQTTLEGMLEHACRGEKDLVVGLPSLSCAEACASAPVASGGALVFGTDSIPGATWAIRIFAAVEAPTSRPLPAPKESAAAHPPQIVYDFRAGMVPARVAAAALETEPGVLAASLQTRALMPMSAGTPAILFAGGIEAVPDFEVEISMGGWLADVVGDEIRHGLRVSCSAIVDAAGRAHLDAHAAFADVASLRTYSFDLSGVTLNSWIPELITTASDFSGEVRLGSWILLHSTPLHGTAHELVVLVRVNLL